MPKVKRICKHCGKVQYVYPCYADRPYCSHACAVTHRTDWPTGPAWSDAEEALLQKRYPTADLDTLAKELERSISAIQAKAEKLGVRRQGIRAKTTPDGRRVFVRYRVNERFFDAWTPDMAYVLGFVLADGCITANGLLKIDSADQDILVDIRNALDSTHPVKAHWFARSTKPTYCLAIRRRYFTVSLAKHGIHPAKTYDVHWPDSPSSMFPHLLRGYFDGDGYVYFHNGDSYSRRIEASFSTASAHLLQDLQERLMTVHITAHLYESHRYAGNYRLRIGTKDSMKLYELMYPSAVGLHLLRKRTPFESYLS